MSSPKRKTERTALVADMPSGSIQAGPDRPVMRNVAQDGFWTVKELACYLRISERWIHERTRRNEIPCHRLGAALRFDPREVHLWMMQRRGSTAASRDV